MVVQPVSVVECRFVPEEMAGWAEAVMEFDEVGMALPVATFHTSNVALPLSTCAFQALIVHANGTANTPYWVLPAVNAAGFAGEPKAKPRDRARI